MILLTDELLEQLGDEYLEVKSRLFHIHDAFMTFNQFLEMRLQELREEVSKNGKQNQTT